MTNNKVYFGTRDRMRWVKPPAVNTPLSASGWSLTGNDLNGGGYSKMSPTASRDYQFSWAASPAKDIYDITDYRTGAYGTGLLYYLDPFAMRSNALSSAFSVPSTLCSIGRMGGSYSTPTGSRVDATNLFTNPSFETTSGTVEVYRNYALDPNGANASGISTTVGIGMNHWAGTGNTASISRNEDAPWSLSGKAYKATWSAVTNPESGTIQVAGFKPWATVAGLYTVTVRVKTSGVALPSSKPASISDFGAGGTLSAYGNITHSDGTQTLWATINVTDPATMTTNPRVDWYVSGLTVGASIEYSMNDAYLGAYQPNRQWFSGTYSPDPDLTPAWTGTANASASALYGVPVSQTSNNSATVVRSYRSQGRKHGFSLRTTPMSNSADSNVFVAGTGALTSMTGNGVTFEAGKTYTAQGWVKGTHTSGVTNNPKRIQFISNTVTGWTGAQWAISSTVKTDGEWRLERITFTVPATAVSAALQVTNGGTQGMGDVWWDDLVLVEGSYTGEYFDGSTPNGNGYAYAWTGSANASTSVRTIPILSNRYTGTLQPLPVAVTSANSPKHYIPCPPKYRIWVAYVASATLLRANNVTVPRTDPTATSLTWQSYSDSVELHYQGSGTLWGAVALVLPIGEEPPPTYEWQPGKGNSGLRFSGEPSITGISAVVGGESGLVSGSATFKETGLWE